MNKKVIFILWVCIVLLLAGCVTKGEIPTAGETTVPLETQEQVQPTTEENLPGIIDNPFSNDGFWNNPGYVAEGETQPEVSNTEAVEETEPPYAESQPAQNQGDESSTEMTYEKYISMSGNDQMAFFNTFASVEDFVSWYNAAKEKYEAEHPYIEIENGEIDLDSLFGGN